jgi:hypothetical protein
MKLQKQLLTTDCWRTCIASILDMDARNVPHFYQDQRIEVAEQNMAAAKVWLKEHGYSLISLALPDDLPFDFVLQTVDHIAPDHHAIISGRSRSGLNHAVIVRDKHVVMDPLTGSSFGSQQPFVGPCTHGTSAWLVELVVKL